MVRRSAPRCFSGGLLLLTAARHRARCIRHRSLALALPVIVLASFPRRAARATRSPWLRRSAVPGAGRTVDRPRRPASGSCRCSCAACRRARAGASLRPLRALVGGLLLAAPICFAGCIAPIEPWFAPASRGAPTRAIRARRRSRCSPRRRELLERRARRSLEDQRPGVADLYFVGVRADGARGRVPQGRRGGAHVMDERWGTDGPLDRARQQPAHAADHAVRDGHQPARDAERDRRGHRRRRRRRDALPREPRHARNRRSTARSRRSSSCDHAGAGCAAARRRGHQVADRRRVGVLLRRLRRRARRRPHARRHRRAGGPHAFGCDGRTPPTFFGDAFFQQGLARTTSFEGAFDVAKARVERARARRGLCAAVRAAMADRRRDGGEAQVAAHARRRARCTVRRRRRPAE